jgi:hypothetical protein
LFGQRQKLLLAELKFLPELFLEQRQKVREHPSRQTQYNDEPYDQDQLRFHGFTLKNEY